MFRLRNLLLLAALSGLFIVPTDSRAGARVYIRVAPPVAKVRVVRPANPYRRGVWVNGHYRHNGHRHVWVRGHYVQTRSGFVYVQPHWKKTRRGYYFVPGHWVKR